MGRIVLPANDEILWTTTGSSGSPASPFTSRFFLGAGLATGLPDTFYLADLHGTYYIRYHLNNVDTVAHTYTLNVGTDPNQPEQILTGAQTPITQAIAAGGSFDFNFPSPGLIVQKVNLTVGPFTFWSSYTLSCEQTTVPFSVSFGGLIATAGVLNAPPTSVTAKPGPGCNRVSYTDTGAAAGTLYRIYRTPNDPAIIDGPYTLIADNQPAAPYTYSDFAAPKTTPSWYAVESIDPLYGVTWQHTDSAGSIPGSLGGGRSMARDMLTLGFFG